MPPVPTSGDRGFTQHFILFILLNKRPIRLIAPLFSNGGGGAVMFIYVQHDCKLIIYPDSHAKLSENYVMSSWLSDRTLLKITGLAPRTSSVVISCPSSNFQGIMDDGRHTKHHRIRPLVQQAIDCPGELKRSPPNWAADLTGPPIYIHVYI